MAIEPGEADAGAQLVAERCVLAFAERRRQVQPAAEDQHHAERDGSRPAEPFGLHADVGGPEDRLPDRRPD
jgi:hypothetical protein